MSDELQDHNPSLDNELIEGGWQKPVSPPTSMLRPPGALPKPATQSASSSGSGASANSNG